MTSITYFGVEGGALEILPTEGGIMKGKFESFNGGTLICFKEKSCSLNCEVYY